MIKKKYRLATIIIVAGAALFFYYQHGNSGKEWVITLNDQGFSPARLVIKIGDTIVFKSAQNRSFWPASNLHPTHTLYPEFDPKEPIISNASWSFTFTKPGIWEYHDHLAPVYKGVVEVGNGQGAQSNAGDPCTKRIGENSQCWQKRIDTALDQGGVSAAFDIIAELYQDPLFQPDCHSYVHRIGERAYRMYAAGKDMRLSPKTSYCGYGFYHGFMETLLHSTKNIQEARDFCTRADHELSSQTSDAKGACYHGIGHGAVDGTDPQARGDPHKIIAPAMKLCKIVADEHNTSIGSPFFRCITGIYNALEVLSANPRYAISSLRIDPFSFCMKEPIGYQEPCATNMVPILLADSMRDFRAMTKRIEKIQESPDAFFIRAMALSALFHEFTRYVLAGTLDISDGVHICQSLIDRSRLACMEGLSGGHMKYGEPTKEYIKGLAFCRSPLLADDERTLCFKYILTRLRIWYDSSETKRICGLVEKIYQHFCM